MRRKGWIILIVILAVGGWTVGLGILSARVLADMTTRPILALVSANGTRIPAQLPGGPRKPDEAQIAGAASRRFGFDTVYLLPDGSTTTCRFRLSGATCDGGWSPERTGG